ncbi:MAG TPA: helix-turn-helix transcriptional regulator [Steroidobacteraceae bacterium]|nr:helix-turn-helix transcriptional regulator [Steroidobacteraceae bacterium]
MRSRSILRSLGEEVRALRTQKDLSQESLAGLAGIHTNVVGRLERGSYNPTVLILAALAMKLGVTLEQLFRGAERR